MFDRHFGYKEVDGDTDITCNGANKNILWLSHQPVCIKLSQFSIETLCVNLVCIQCLDSFVHNPVCLSNTVACTQVSLIEHKTLQFLQACCYCLESGFTRAIAEYLKCFNEDQSQTDLLLTSSKIRV